MNTTRDPKVGLLLILELIIYTILVFSFRHLINPLTISFLAIFIPTVIYGEFGGELKNLHLINKIKRLFKKKLHDNDYVNEKEKVLEDLETINNSLVNDDTNLSQNMLNTKNNDGRDYLDILKEKNQYISLLELVDKYEKLLGKKRGTISDSTPVIDFSEIDGIKEPVYIKK